MRIDELSPFRFRNLKFENLTFGTNINIFFGENGQGKSNLLEAIHLVFSLRSFRPTESHSYLTNSFSQTEPCRLRAKVERKQLISKIEIQFLQGRKKAIANGKSVTASVLTNQYPAVVFSPDSLNCIKLGPEFRRHLIDDFLATTSNKNHRIIEDYRKLLRSRNRLLREFAGEPEKLKAAWDLYQSINEPFISASIRLTWARLECIREIEPFFRSSLRTLFKESDLAVGIDYCVSGKSVRGHSLDQIDNALRQRALELQIIEASRGISLVGPQKHEVCFLWRGSDSRFYSSQGQQRAIILAFKMAQIRFHYERFGEYPVLLLDDVLSELDLERRNQLLDFLANLDSQIFLTTTDLAFDRKFSESDLSQFEVKDGFIAQTK